MKQSFYLVTSLIVVFLFGAWGHSLYTRHFVESAKMDETLWGDPAEIEEAFALQRNLHATVTSLALETSSVYSSQGAKAWLISDSRLDSLLRALNAYVYKSNSVYGNEQYQVVLARYPSGRPKFISVLRFYSHDHENLLSICGVEKNSSSDLFVFCPVYDEKGSIKTLLRYDSPDGKYSAAKYPLDETWRCSIAGDSVHSVIHATKPEYCSFDLRLLPF